MVKVVFNFYTLSKYDQQVLLYSAINNFVDQIR